MGDACFQSTVSTGGIPNIVTLCTILSQYTMQVCYNVSKISSAPGASLTLLHSIQYYNNTLCSLASSRGLAEFAFTAYSMEYTQHMTTVQESVLCYLYVSQESIFFSFQNVKKLRQDLAYRQVVLCCSKFRFDFWTVFRKHYKIFYLMFHSSKVASI